MISRSTSNQKWRAELLRRWARGSSPLHKSTSAKAGLRLVRKISAAHFSELNEADLVVHLEHGIGRFVGLLRLPKSPHTVEAGVSPAFTKGAADTAATTDGTQEVLALEFADEAKLYVPLEQAYLVSR